MPRVKSGNLTGSLTANWQARPYRSQAGCLNCIVQDCSAAVIVCLGQQKVQVVVINENDVLVENVNFLLIGT